jgi:hypothetical protein
LSGTTKRGRHFQTIARFKARLQKESTAELERRFAMGILVKEAAIATREILGERSKRNGIDEPS